MSDGYHSRQSFLGEDLPEVLNRTRIAVVGVSGGGSHVVQQTAHIGFQNQSLFDPDIIKDVNLHRHVGATRADVEAQRPKVELGERVIRNLWPAAEVRAFQKRWQDAVEELREVDLIFACLDGIRARLDLEATARRYLIPLIDIGLGLNPVGKDGKLMSGQVALSMPGGPCLRCMQLLTEQELADEAKHAGGYEGFGPAPQVVWANGVLASTAVGVAVDLLTGWNTLAHAKPSLRLQYVGNSCQVHPFRPSPWPDRRCDHYPEREVGDP